MVLLPRAISDWDALPRAAVASPSLDVSESGPGARWEENQGIGVRVVRQPWPGGQRRARLVLPALPSPPCKLQMFDDGSSERGAGGMQDRALLLHSQLGKAPLPKLSSHPPWRGKAVRREPSRSPSTCPFAGPAIALPSREF